MSRPGVYAIEGCRVTADYGAAAVAGGVVAGGAQGQTAAGAQQGQAAAAALAVADQLLLRVEPA